MKTQQCLACGHAFHPRPQSPQQKYCPAKVCQCERRRRWQQAKWHTDPDYRDNQRHAQQAWRASHPHYWRTYRAAHPAYVERNRALQRLRNRRRSNARVIAKSDASTPVFPFASGIYRMMDGARGGIAKKNAWMVKITVLSAAYGPAS